MMAKPLIHARNSMKRYGGSVDDYLEIHNFMDSTKSALPDVRHRAILHSSFGIFLVERSFGIYLTNTDGKQVSIRSIAEDHVREDLGFIPTMEKWFGTMQIEDWMQSPVVKTKYFIAMEIGND